MATKTVTDASLTAVADAIRAKGGTASPLTFPTGFVQAIGDIQTGGTLIQKTITQNGTYEAQDDNADGYSEVTVNVSGGGGASNVVMGTFQSALTDQAIDIDIPYTGNGYPLILVIYPTGGPFVEGSDYYNLVKRYALNTFCFVKCDFGLAPTYASLQDKKDVGAYFGMGKNSTSDPTIYSGNVKVNATMCLDRDATTGIRENTVRVRSNKKISVYMAGTSFGFVPNISYSYMIVYSE